MLFIIKKLIPKKIFRNIFKIISKFLTKVNGKYVEGFFVRSGDFKFLVEVKDMSVGRKLRTDGSYGREELERIFKLVSKESSIIFVGAHIGALAIPTAKRVKSCIFIEANPKTFQFLNNNIDLNNISNVKAYNIAVGERKGSINFVLNTVNSGGSKREPVIKQEMYYYDKPETISIPLVTLDSICDDQNEKYDLVFMDIEGSEIFALKGMDSVLNRSKALIIEFIPHAITNVANSNVDEFVAYTSKYFSFCYVPSKGKYIQSQEFKEYFTKMFYLNEIDDGLVFTKKFFNFSKT